MRPLPDSCREVQMLQSGTLRQATHPPSPPTYSRRRENRSRAQNSFGSILDPRLSPARSNPLLSQAQAASGKTPSTAVQAALADKSKMYATRAPSTCQALDDQNQS